MKQEIEKHLNEVILPFWMKLRDEEQGGYYGYMSHDLKIDKKAVKGCILNSRILWFFSNAYIQYGKSEYLEHATHAFAFLENYCFDSVNGGLYWSVTYNGSPYDTTKHTYNQAFGIYALASYYAASRDVEALGIASKLFEMVESKCTDEYGYLEAFDEEFRPIENDKLSENGVIAEKTMNTLLHVFEAYTELFRVTRSERVKKRMEWILDTFADKLYNPQKHRLEVFFDREMNSILDLQSYGHDIEAAWLIDRGLKILGNPHYIEKLRPITDDLTRQVFEVAFDGHSLDNECENGVVNTDRIWWVQAEAVVGFMNMYEKDTGNLGYLLAANAQWEYIAEKLVDHREGGEWHWKLDKEGRADTQKPVVEPWKCPYHNGRMCLEIIRRGIDVK